MEQPENSPEQSAIPFRTEMEKRLNAKVVTFNADGIKKPGGQCRCCGSGPEGKPDWREEPWFVFEAGLCDADGIYYAALCEGCLEDIRAENANRPESIRDVLARELKTLLGEDLDGAQSLMDD